MSQDRRQASEEEVDVTPAMTSAGVSTLLKYISADYPPIYPYEDVVTAIVKAMARSQDEENYQ